MVISNWVYQLLNIELESNLKKRIELHEVLREAWELGDEPENAVLDAAKHTSELVEEKIRLIEILIPELVISNTDEIVLGSRIKLHDQVNKTTKAHVLINIDLIKILSFENHTPLSIEAPLGKQLIGSKLNDFIQINLPTGITRNYQIIEIT